MAMRLGMGEHLEAVVARDGDQRDAGVLGGAQRERGRRRDRDDDRRAADRGLLDHLDRDAAGQQDDAGIAGDVAASEGAGQLVERVVPADILAQRDDPALGFQNAAAWTARVSRLKRLQRPAARRRQRRRHRPTCESRMSTSGGGRIASARLSMPHKPAAGRTRHVTAALGERVDPRLGDPHPQLDAVVARDDLDVVDLVRPRDDAFRQAEADGEILEIVRRRHHHRIGEAVVGERDRGFLGDRALAR